MAVSKRLRYEVLRRDRNACRYCGVTADSAQITVDHVVPKSLGGKDDADNLVAACMDCNSGKSSAIPPDELVEDVAAAQQRWEEARRRALELKQRRQAHRPDITEFDREWRWWHHEVNGEKRALPRPRMWESSIEQWLERGMTPADLVDGIAVAMKAAKVPAADKWRYFCGVMWRQVEKLDQEAADIADTLTEPDEDDYYIGFDDGRAAERSLLLPEIARLELEVETLTRQLAQTRRPSDGPVAMADALDGFLAELEEVM